MMSEIGITVHPTIKCDASAAIGIVHRKGLGKVRHIDVTQLWLQQKVATGIIMTKKVGTGENTSDALTKHLPHSEIVKHMTGTSQTFVKEE